MQEIQKITSPANSKIKRLMQWNQKAKQREKDNIFLAEGRKMFEEAPKDWILEVYFSQNYYDKQREWIELEIQQGNLKTDFCYIVEDDVFKRISDTITPQGVLCVLKRPSYLLEELLYQENPMLILLEDLQDPGNLGTIVRTGEGAGISGVIASRDTVDIYNPKTVRATMGSIYRVPVLYVQDLKEVIKQLRMHEITTYAAHLKGNKDYDECDYTKGSAFLIGNEGRGLREETADCADRYLKIPMEGKVESLNASIAAALLMYEGKRQRKGSGK